MDFGYSIGDFIALLKLANQIRKRFVNAPHQFKALSEDVKSLSNVLRDVEDFELETGLVDQKRQRLNDLSRECHDVLVQLQTTLDKFQEIQQKGWDGMPRRVWKKLQWDQSEMNEIQDRIHRNISVFNFFLNGLTSHLAVATTQRIDRMVQRQDSQLRQEIIHWLTSTNYATQQHYFHSQRQSGTGEWLFDTKKFQLWWDNASQTLYCPGIPGAGKTILTSIVINHIEETFEHDSDIGLAYVYCDFRQRHEQRQGNLIASLLRQLVQRQDHISQTVEKMYSGHCEKGTRPSDEELSKTLSSVMSEYSRVFILVDALDEYQMIGSSLERFVSEIFTLQRKHSVSFFATSRHNPRISAMFDSGLKQDVRANSQDVHKYLQGHLHELPSFVSRNKELQMEIKDRVTEAVDGMFLLAHLHLRSLVGKPSAKAIKKSLQQLPSGSMAIDVAYKDAMQRVRDLIPDQRDLALQALSWVACSQRLLNATELQHALAVEIGENEFDPDNIPDIEDIITACAGLVNMDDQTSTIRLVHYTAQEYFERTWQTWFPDAHHDMANTCLTYLCYDTFQSGACVNDDDLKKRLTAYPLYRYSAINWGHHVRCQTVDEATILRLLQDPDKVSACSQILSSEWQPALVAGWSRRVPKNVSAAHLVAYFGLQAALEALVRRGMSYDEEDSHGRTPLFWAAANGQDVIIHKLLQLGVDIENEEPSLTPLAVAARNGHEDAVRVLLQAGAEPDIEDIDSRTPLSRAAENGHDPVIHLMMRYHANLDIPDSDGRTALLWAARCGHYTTVKLLLDAGEDPDPKDSVYGWTALSWACGNGHYNVAKILLEADVRVDSRDSNNWTPLFWAVDNGYVEIVRLLLTAKGIEVNARDDLGLTPLSLAAWSGNEEAIQLLLKNGGDPHTKANNGETPLSFAARRGHARIIALLLHAGADPNGRDLTGRTPLLYAADVGDPESLKLLIRAGTDLQMRDNTGLTALMHAASQGDVDVIKILLAAGYDPNSPDPLGRTPLMYAAAAGRRKASRVLVETGAHTNACDQWGRNPLINAAAAGSLAITQLLLSQGEIDIARQDRYGRDAKYEAQARGHTEVTDALESYRTDGTRVCNVRLPPQYSAGHHRICDICLVGIRDDAYYFHCGICYENDFDICRFCEASGASCLVDEHQLTRRPPREQQ